MSDFVLPEKGAGTLTLADMSDSTVGAAVGAYLTTKDGATTTTLGTASGVPAGSDIDIDADWSALAKGFYDLEVIAGKDGSPDTTVNLGTAGDPEYCLEVRIVKRKSN